ncbi:MAG TPA: YicC family protein [Sedimenticola thiotaurini]|uniref:YicC family protein n=1 Tax=Sedimenticola thiotaurini TaxID=1543721 RepID=A0A831RK20_9GAMM|nr:YicC family protein [Sedimenticola thiotaurini]
MICSMTAFARARSEDENGELIWEIRSVNHRFLEPMIRLPEELRSLDPLVREQLTRRLGRGKVDCTLRYHPSSDAVAGVEVNTRLARQIIDAAEEVGHMLHGSSSVRAMDILRWPGVLEQAERDMGPVQQQALVLLQQALDDLIAARRREGDRLAGLIRQRVEAMRGYVEQARAAMPRVLEAVKERLRARLAELREGLDETRLEQEVALLAQRLDVDEEMDRLASHLDEVEQVLQREEPVGRRLDFLMQELNREANTLASKSNDVETTRIGVELKVLIEQMREQVQNIE